jgi:hypothetical protein
MSIRENDGASAALMSREGSADSFGFVAATAPHITLLRNLGVEWGIIRAPYIGEHRALDLRAPEA